MRSIINHVSLGVSDFDRAAPFYDAILYSLGYDRVMDYSPHAIGYGDGVPEFWIGVPVDGGAASAGNGVHVCFIARSREAVHAFHAAGLAAGGRDNGAPGPRPDYGPDYYAAFLLDPDGNKLEAVFMQSVEDMFAVTPAKGKAKARVKPKAKPTKAAEKRGTTKKAGKKPVKKAVAKRSAKKTAKKATKTAAKRR